MLFFIPKRNVLTETIDSAKEESLDKEVRYSAYSDGRFCTHCGSPLPEFPDVDASKKTSGFGAYMLRRTVLCVIKLALCVIFFRLYPKFFPPSDELDFWHTNIATLYVYLLYIPLIVVYTIAALICAPFKIALTERRLREVGASSSSLWLLAWFLTIITRLLLSLCPPGLFFVVFCDFGSVVNRMIVAGLMSLAPLATAAAYAFEFSLLWKPRVKNGDLRNDVPSV